MGIRRLALIGHDWGGVVALRYAIENPESVSRLVIMDAALYPEWVEHQRTSPDYAIIRRMVKNSLFRTMARSLITKGTVKRAITPRNEKILSAEDLDHYRFFFKRGLKAVRLYSKEHLQWIEENAPRLSARLKELRIPTLIIWGSEDPYFPPKTPEHLHDDIQGSSLHVLASTGHWPFEERPEQVIGLVTSFLQAQGTGAIKIQPPPSGSFIPTQ
jgi:pimeloyl-ACP methyl ester carboxylesterase